MSERIFGAWWSIYYAAGWTQLTILPARSKQPPRSGTTGREQAPHNETDYRRWTQEEAESGDSMNIGVILPKTVIALDIDSSDGHRRKIDGYTNLKAREEELGPLPATWTSGHGDPGSPYRHYLYQVPNNTNLRSTLEGVDLIQWSLRYLTAPPSIHPSGEAYFWLKPDGTRADTFEVPHPDDLPMLPKQWIQDMTQKTHTPRQTHGDTLKKQNSVGTIALGTSPRSTGQLCTACRSVLNRWQTDPCYDASSRHDGTQQALGTLAFLDAEGHSGAATAADEIVRQYPSLIADRSDAESATHEAIRMRKWAWGHTNGEWHLFDPCRTYRPVNKFINLQNKSNEPNEILQEQNKEQSETERRPHLNPQMQNLVDAGLEDYDAILIVSISLHRQQFDVPVSAKLREIQECGGKLSATDVVRIQKRLATIRTRQDLSSPIE